MTVKGTTVGFVTLDTTVLMRDRIRLLIPSAHREPSQISKVAPHHVSYVQLVTTAMSRVYHHSLRTHVNQNFTVKVNSTGPRVRKATTAQLVRRSKFRVHLDTTVLTIQMCLLSARKNTTALEVHQNS